MQWYCKDEMKGTRNKNESAETAQTSALFTLSFPPGISSVRCTTPCWCQSWRSHKEQLWALPAQLMAALQGPHCGELPGVGCPPQCYLISAPNWFLHNLFLPQTIWMVMLGKEVCCCQNILGDHFETRYTPL